MTTTSTINSNVPAANLPSFQAAVEWCRRTVSICYNDFLVPIFTVKMNELRQGYVVGASCFTLGVIALIISKDPVSEEGKTNWRKIALTVLSVALFLVAGAAWMSKNNRFI